MSLLWMPRDLDIVETLTRRVRLLSLPQIAAIWWPAVRSPRPVRRRLRKLADAGLLQRSILNVHPLLDVREPLAAWQLGQSMPDFEAVAQRAQKRWRYAAEPQEVFYATRLAANLFGSSASGLPSLHHWDHDLLLGEVYVHFRRARPADAGQWIGEDAFGKAGYRIKDPDAFLVDQSGAVVRVIESTGRYSERQVESFHDHCAEHNLPYELW